MSTRRPAGASLRQPAPACALGTSRSRTHICTNCVLTEGCGANTLACGHEFGGREVRFEGATGTTDVRWRVGGVSTGSTGGRGLFRRKPVEAFVTETNPDTEGGELERSIGLFQLTLFGVGATIGTGIFIVLTEAVPEAGPAVLLSFALAGITAALTAVCYAELASTIPVSGSSYSYT